MQVLLCLLALMLIDSQDVDPQTPSSAPLPCRAELCACFAPRPSLLSSSLGSALAFAPELLRATTLTTLPALYVSTNLLRHVDTELSKLSLVTSVAVAAVAVYGRASVTRPNEPLNALVKVSSWCGGLA